MQNLTLYGFFITFCKWHMGTKNVPLTLHPSPTSNGPASGGDGSIGASIEVERGNRVELKVGALSMIVIKGVFYDVIESKAEELREDVDKGSVYRRWRAGGGNQREIEAGVVHGVAKVRGDVCYKYRYEFCEDFNNLM
jgi:hypothetical protein